MTKSSINFFLILSLVLFSSFKPIENADAILGIWLVGSKKGKVEITKSGNKYFGKLIWIAEPNDANGKPKTDVKNPETSKKNQPILGLQILSEFEYDKENSWDEGEIYDPESGKTYSCTLTLKNPNTLDVRGYVGFSWIGRTDTWTRIK